MKKIIYVFTLALSFICPFLILTSCGQNESLNKEISVENNIPLYRYSVNVFDNNNKLLSQNMRISDISDISSIRLSLKNFGDSTIDLCFYVLINGIMIDMSTNNRIYHNKTVGISLNAFECTEMIIELFPNYLSKEKNKVSFVFISEANDCFVDEIEPIKNYTSVLSLTAYTSENSNDLKDDICDYEYETIPLTDEYIEIDAQILTETIGNGFIGAIMPRNESWFLYQPHTIFINTETVDSFDDFVINMFAPAGEYITMIFAEGNPVPVFNNKYYLVWQTDGKSLIKSNIRLSEHDSNSINNIFAITLPLDLDNSFIYDSIKTNIYDSNQDSRSETKSYKSYSVKLSDNNGKVYNPEDNHIYSGGFLTYKYLYKQNSYYTEENHRIMVLLNGIPQMFQVGESEESLYYDYSISPSETKELILRIMPQLSGEDNEFNISVVTLFNSAVNMFNESSLDNTSLLHRMSVHYTVANSAGLELSKSKSYGVSSVISPISVAKSNNANTVVCLYNDYNVSQKNSSSGHVFIPSGQDSLINIEINNFDVSAYSLLVFCNGELVEFFDNQKYLYFSIDQINSVYTFQVTIPFEYLKKNNSLLFVISKGQNTIVSYNDLNRRCSCALRLSASSLTNYDCPQPLVSLKKTGNTTEIMVDDQENQDSILYSTTILADNNTVTDLMPRLWYECSNASVCSSSQYTETINSYFSFMNCLLITSFGNNESINVIKYKTYKDGKSAD